jgi:hypothetical protein
MIREKLSMARDEVRWLMTTATIILVALAGSFLVVLVEIPHLLSESPKEARGGVHPKTNKINVPVARG